GAHCGALLRSGQYDWVLVEITQESEWAAGTRSDLSSVLALIARDPDFNLADLEDRASVVFWRRAAASRTGKPDPLRKIASPQICEQFTAQSRNAQEWEFFGDCAVGSVDTLGIASDDQWDRAMVEVRWEGERMIAHSGGTITRTGDRSLSRTVLELSRRTGVKTNAGYAISSSH